MDFSELRYGLFLHYGLYSLLGRGEWVWNKEGIPRNEYVALKERFQAEAFNAPAICKLARQAGMRYIVLTTMHHDGFRLYPTSLSDFHVGNSPCQRDLVKELVDAARAEGLAIGLYHSLNNWHDRPDSVGALESQDNYEVFLEATMARLEELVRRYQPINVLWYDGWWPFNAEGWQAEQMNERMRKIQPDLIFNGRNGLPGDFATPEGHLSAPKPWRPWEACISLNDSWGHHSGDTNWKTPSDLIQMLATVARGRGNLLLNAPVLPDGSLPEPFQETTLKVGEWLRENGEAIFDVERFDIDLQHRADHRGDLSHHGIYTASGHNMYLILQKNPATAFALNGLETKVEQVTLCDGTPLPFQQQDRRLLLQEPVPERADGLPLVLRFSCTEEPRIYGTGGLRLPKVQHPRYDPVESDIAL